MKKVENFEKKLEKLKNNGNFEKSFSILKQFEILKKVEKFDKFEKSLIICKIFKQLIKVGKFEKV